VAVTLNAKVMQLADGGAYVRLSRATSLEDCLATVDLWIPFSAIAVADLAGRLEVREDWLRERLGASLPSYLPRPGAVRQAPPALERSTLWRSLALKYHPDTAGDARFGAAEIMQDINALVAELTK
jgi:hypothetical protein